MLRSAGVAWSFYVNDTAFCSPAFVPPYQALGKEQKSDGNRANFAANGETGLQMARL
jgi:hypothetical protein